MSRIWKLPVKVPQWVNVNISSSTISITWPKWELKFQARPEISMSLEWDNVLVTRINDEKLSKSLHWLTRTMIWNMMTWVTKWFEKKLQILWVWYTYKVEWQKVILTLWFSHPVHVEIWKGIEVKIDQKEKDIMLINWIDKQKVWEFAAQIRKLKRPEPYKWKWIRYVWEYVRKKAWKSAKK